MATLTRPLHKLTCRACGVVFESKDKWRTACSPEHFGPAPRTRSSRPQDSRHKQRRASAPGLTEKELKALRDLWIRQGRDCVYCLIRKGTTLDHVVPLRHGGTNHEGNLAPACVSCNSRKSSLLVIEVKAGRFTPAQLAFKPYMRG